MSDSTTPNGLCGCILLIIIGIIGSMSVNYVLFTFTGNKLPALVAAIVGFLAGPIVVTLALITWILQVFNII